MSTTITTYLTESDVETAYSTDLLTQALDDPVNPAGTLNTTLMDQLLARVQGTMDSKIGFKYALPLVVEDSDATGVQNVLRSRALALFFWMMIREKPHMAEGYKGAQAAHDDALRWLEDVAAGRAFLGTSQVVPGAQVRGAGVMSAGHKGPLSRERLKDW